MQNLLVPLEKLWQLLWGKPYYRFSVALLSVGAALAAGPEFWEVVLGLVIYILSSLYPSNQTPPQFSFGSSLLAQLLGALFILSAIALFVWLYLKDQKEQQQTQAAPTYDFNSVSEILERIKHVATLAGVQDELTRIEAERIEWARRISSSQKLILSLCPTSEHVSASIHESELFARARRESRHLKSARDEELRFRLHELRWLGLIQRSDDKTRYLRTVSGSKLLGECSR